MASFETAPELELQLASPSDPPVLALEPEAPPPPVLPDPPPPPAEPASEDEAGEPDLDPEETVGISKHSLLKVSPNRVQSWRRSNLT